MYELDEKQNNEADQLKKALKKHQIWIDQILKEKDNQSIFIAQENNFWLFRN